MFIEIDTKKNMHTFKFVAILDLFRDHENRYLGTFKHVWRSVSVLHPT